MLEKYSIDIRILSDYICQKHLAGEHDQRTHGDRFGHVPGVEGNVQVHVGGGAAGDNVVARDSSGKPTRVTLQSGEKVPSSSSEIPPVYDPADHTTKGRVLTEQEILGMKALNDFHDGKIDYSKDALLGAIYKAQEFDGKPHVVSDDELTKHIKNGETEGYRGLSNAQDNGYHTEFEKGEYYPGFGVYGNGTYVATVKRGLGMRASTKSIAKKYAGNNGVIMRMSIKKDAKMGKYTDLEKEASAIVKEYADNVENLKGKMSKADKGSLAYQNMKRELREKEMLRDFYNDIGRYAASKGYDGYYVNSKHPDSNKTQYVIVLNRTAVRVSNDYILP